jgi:hypothetical protein
VAGDGGRKDAELVEPIVTSWWQDEDDEEPPDAAAVTERIRARFDAQYPPGNLAGDLNRFVEADYFGIDRWQAAAALAEHDRFLPSGFKNPRVARCFGRLIARHGSVGAERILRTEIFPEALMLAFRGRAEAQHIRLGRRNVKDSAGVWRKFKPEILHIEGLFYRWLQKETFRHAGVLVADRMNDSPRKPREQLVDDEHELERFLAKAETPADVIRYLAPTRGRNPARDLVMFSMATAGQTCAEIGRALGMTAVAVRKQLSRSRRRAAR